MAAFHENRYKEPHPLFIGAPTEAPRIEITFMKEESFVLSAALRSLVNRKCRPVSLIGI